MSGGLTDLSDADLLRMLGESEPKAAPASPAPSVPSPLAQMSDDDLLRALGSTPPEPSMLAKAGTVAKDVGRSFETGVDRGVAGLVGLPNALIGWTEKRAEDVSEGIVNAFGGKSARQRGIATPRVADGFPSQEGILRSMNGGHEPHKPTTTAGEYAQTVGEFLPGAGSGPAALLKFGVLPALASETAGQAVKGTAAEPWVRGGVALATGIGAAAAGRSSAAERIFDRAAGTISSDDVTRAQALVDDATARGVSLSWPEAVQQVVGPNRMGDVLRVIEGEGGLSDFFAKRPDQVKSAGNAALDAVAPAGASPAQTGEAVQRAAQQAMAGTPEGQAVIRATQAAGPRVTPDQAGQVIQREMLGVRDARENARSTQGNLDYEAAKAVPENIGIERTVTVERPGEPVLQTIDNGAPRSPQYDPPPQGPHTLASVAPKRPEMPAGATSNGPSLWNYMSENGGLGLERGDVKAAGLDRYRRPGVSNLVREGGPSIDNHWRENLIEKGYLPPDRDGGMARNVHDEVLTLLEQEARGRRVYPYHWLDGDEASGFGRMSDEFQAASGTALRDVRTALEGAGVDVKGVHKDILDRAAAALVSGAERDPLAAFEGAVMAMREPVSRGPTSRLVPTAVTEEVSAPRFGQVNPQAALNALDRQVRSAKGDVRSTLETIRRDLFEYGTDPASGVRETDLSVEGLLHARERLDQHINAAQSANPPDMTKARDLEIVRRSLDEQLKGVPEVATADANFAANSRPLDAFGGNTPLGRVTGQDPRTRRMQTPAEQVPGQLQGSTAAREFLANATPEARAAFQGREITRILDEVGAGGGMSADAVRGAIRKNEDLLRQLPEARTRLSRLAGALQAREAIERGPMGQIAKRPVVDDAIGVLFPAKPNEGSAQDVGRVVSALVRANPHAAQQLVRSYLGTEFAEATQRLQSGANQAGGAKFATVIRGNALQDENLRAALRALPNGTAIEAGFSRFLDIMEATGQRQAIGSRTTFNAALREELKKDGLKREGLAAISTGGLKLPSRIMDAFDNWQAGKNVEELSRLFTSVEGGQRLAALATAKPGANMVALLSRLVALANHGGQSADAPKLAK